MKILYVAGVGKYGTYVLSRDIFTIWLKHGYDIVFVNPTRDSPLVEFAYEHKIPIYFLKLFRTFRIDEALKLSIIARREKVDVIHACNLTPGRFLCRVAAWLSNRPLVLCIATPILVYNTNYLIGRLQRFLHKWSLSTSCGIFAMTEYLAEQVRSTLKITKNLKMAVIPAGVDLSQIKKKEYLEHSYNNNRLIRAVHIARLAPDKGQDIILRALAYIFQKGYQVSVDFIGDADYKGYRDYLYSLIARLDLPVGMLNLLGYHPVSQVYRELAEYDMFLHPSRTEGQGIAVVEAMSAGLPVIASEAGGLKELVIHRKTGLLVPIDDYRALAEAVIWLIQNPAQRIEMGEAGYLRVKENFSLEVTESKLIKFYEHLADSMRDI